MSTIRINRAPVLTLWGAVVAERMGYSPDTALTLGRAVAGMNAQSKGRRLGVFPPGEPQDRETGKEALRKPSEEQRFVELLGRSVPVDDRKGELRAISKDRPLEPRAVQRYLEKKFGDRLPEARAAMQALAKAYSPEDLAGRAYSLYEKFRPEIPEGTRGWGAEGELDLDLLESLKSRL